jgi:hypothetical protein
MVRRIYRGVTISLTTARSALSDAGVGWPVQVPPPGREFVCGVDLVEELTVDVARVARHLEGLVGGIIHATEVFDRLIRATVDVCDFVLAAPGGGSTPRAGFTRWSVAAFGEPEVGQPEYVVVLFVPVQQCCFVNVTLSFVVDDEGMLAVEVAVATDRHRLAAAAVQGWLAAHLAIEPKLGEA